MAGRCKARYAMAALTAAGMTVSWTCEDTSGRGITLNGQGDYSTIQAAVDDAGQGDVIFIPNGRYEEKVDAMRISDLTLIGESNVNAVIARTVYGGSGFITKNLGIEGGGIYGVVSVGAYGCRFTGAGVGTNISWILEGNVFACGGSGGAAGKKGQDFSRLAYNDIFDCGNTAVTAYFGINEVVANRINDTRGLAIDYWVDGGGLGLVEDNEFRNNTSGALAGGHPMRYSGPGDLGGGWLGSRGRNIFVGNGIPVIHGETGSYPETTSAKFNYWGTTDPAEIAAMVRDCSDTASLGCIDTSEFLTEEPQVPRGADAWPGRRALDAEVAALKAASLAAGGGITLFTRDEAP
ncbi:MAG: hypothetical protein HYV63_13745 [Candidatus Schekmanbacteria bacterium]|nr:hypothetical protein [Candidatus Schekmanbacteria bacterium]